MDNPCRWSCLVVKVTVTCHHQKLEDEFPFSDAIFLAANCLFFREGNFAGSLIPE